MDGTAQLHATLVSLSGFLVVAAMPVQPLFAGSHYSHSWLLKGLKQGHSCGHHIGSHDNGQTCKVKLQTIDCYLLTIDCSAKVAFMFHTRCGLCG